MSEQVQVIDQLDTPSVILVQGREVVAPDVLLVVPGPQGPAGSYYVYNQANPALVWTINHQLGFNPAVAVFNAGSQQVLAHVQHITLDQTLVTFTIETAGFARLN